MNNNIINSLMDVLPILGEMIHEDVSTCVTDREKCIASFINPKVPVSFKAGDVIPKSNPLMLCMEKRKAMHAIVPKEEHSIDFMAIAYPLIDDNNEVIGAVGIGKSIENSMEIDGVAKDISSSIEQTGFAVNNITQSSQEISNSVNDMVSFINNVKNKIDETDKIISFIQHISTQSNLLALNAAIEAARAGESGKGFSVVSSEMRKLAQNSKDSSDDVSKFLREIKEAINDILTRVSKTNSVISNHAASTEEINATIEEINTAFKKLIDLTRVN